MSYLNSKRSKYFATMAGIIILILVLFNTIFTFMIHKKIAKVVENPGRWPAGAYVYDESIGFDFASNISGPIDDGSFYVKSHQLGYRIGEHEDETSWSPGGLLSLGCSFTYGDEVESGQTFTQQAANALQIPAYNYGICSFSYTHALLKAQELKEKGILDKLRPGYVVLGCWSGLPDRSRLPFPPLASDNLPLPAAYMAKVDGKIEIEHPMKIEHVFSMVEMYREKGTGMSFGKFFRLFFAAPRYIYLYLKNNRLAQKMKLGSSGKTVSDYEVYDFYYTGIEKVFSDYGSRILVLFMPNKYFNEKPDEELLRALEAHPGITFVDGYRAIEKYGVNTRDYVMVHPQPRTHLVYAQAIIEAVPLSRPSGR